MTDNIRLPQPFKISNEFREITVKPIEATYDKKLIIMHCEIYVNDGSLPAFHKCFNVPVDPDIEIEKNPLAINRFVQLTMDTYFVAIIPIVLREYFPEQLPQHQLCPQPVLNSELHLFPL
jgi:hypothetical protein